ncbi:hypothetical protein Tco_0559330 [Tanacetum coccineum]
MLVETINVNFDELPQMASDHVSSDPSPQCSTTILEQDSLSPGPQSQENVPQVAETVTTSNELELLYSPMFSELLNRIITPVVSKSFTIPPPLNIHSTHLTPTQVPTVTAPENINQAETNTENAQFDDNEFINIFRNQIHQSPRGIFINQAKYAQEILKKHGMTSCDSIGTPMATKHLDADLSGIFRYLKDSVNMGLWYLKDTGFELTTFPDLNHAGCLDSRKSISGGIQFLGGDKLVSWSSKKQDCTLMSSAEAEYVSLSACCAQVLWLRTQLTDYGFHFYKIPMYGDSKAAIAILCNPVQHYRTKHIDVRYHFIKEQV